jgi:chromosome segregation ATPase
LEKLQYDLKDDTDIQKSTEMDSLSRKKKKGYSLSRRNTEGLNSNNELHAKVDGYQKSLSEKEEIIQQLTSQVDKSIHALFVYYQKSLSERDEIIQQLTEQADRKKESEEEYQDILTEKNKTLLEKEDAIQQLTSRIYNLNVFTEEFQKSLSEKKETVNQVTARLDSQNVITLEQLIDEEKEGNDNGEEVDSGR